MYGTTNPKCVYIQTHTHSSQYSDFGRAKGIQSGTAVIATCQGYFGHACYMFARPGVFRIVTSLRARRSGNRIPAVEIFSPSPIRSDCPVAQLAAIHWVPGDEAAGA
jgi:hypothetical protein